MGAQDQIAQAAMAPTLLPGGLVDIAAIKGTADQIIEGDSRRPKAEKQQMVAKKASKPRIDCIDGCRFALVAPIIVGHFIRFGTDRQVLLKLLTQENVFVGGFFLISGYVSAYVSTKVGEQDVEQKKLAKPELFFWQKVMGYYPLHFFVSTVFSPMFVLTDIWHKNSAGMTVFHGFLNYSLSQAWFPSAAEIWNPPTWFLSALTFANLMMPTVVLPQIARMSKDGLAKLLWSLGGLSVLQKLSYSTAWQFTCRGGHVSRTTTPHLWNVTRFHPFWALVEIAMGIAAARDVMLDGSDQRSLQPTHPLVYFIASYASIALRLTKLNLNDAMIRSLLFVPVYTKFLKAIHRDCLTDNPRLITRFFGSSVMSRLGALAFPMFILHGPIGQLFYKKAIAKKLWGRVMPKSFFPVYLLLVLLSGHLANEGFMKSKRVQRFSAAVAEFLAKHTNGMLQDKGQVSCGRPAGDAKNPQVVS